MAYDVSDGSRTIDAGTGASIRDVVSQGYCVGCGACAVRSGGVVSLTLSPTRTYTPDLARAGRDDLAAMSQVCPFSYDGAGVTSVASSQGWDSLPHDPVVGRYRAIYTGRLNHPQALMSSSSGGLTTWLLQRLLRDGLVDGVIHVAPTAGKQGEEIFKYRVSTTADQVDGGRKSHYYATTYVDAVNSIRGDGRTYVFVGVSCFVTSLRLLLRQDPELAAQIRYCVGLVCGHLKSQEYAASLAWQLGIAPSDLAAVDFRLKVPGEQVSSYGFGAKRAGDEVLRTKPNRDLVGTNWGHTAFQLKACDYCDDIFAEGADAVLADAWLPQFSSMWQGTNLVVVRERALDQLFIEGAQAEEITLEPADLAAAAQSQAGNIRHRRFGLATRLDIDQRRGRWTPPTRVDEFGLTGYRGARRLLVRLRRVIAAQSVVLFAHARRSGRLGVYLIPMRMLTGGYRVMDGLARRSAHHALNTGVDPGTHTGVAE